MKVSVVTPNYNGKKFLKNYFESLKLNSEFIGEVIIVDNGSNDGSKEFIKDYSMNLSFPVKIIENTENLGFAKAVNQGINESSFEYIFSLNNDTQIHIGAISYLIEAIEKDSKIFSVSSKMIQFNNKNLIDDAGDEYTLLAYTKKAGNNQPISYYLNEREIFSSCAGAALYRKSILDEIGLFDENFFAYVEDVDLSFRAQIYGYKNYYCPNSIVYHIGSATSGSQYNEFKVRLAARNNVWTIYKNYSRCQKISNFIFLVIGFSIKYLFFLKKGFGPVYYEGIKEGLSKRGEIEKINVNSIKNYFRIEWKMIKNTFALLKK